MDHDHEKTTSSRPSPSDAMDKKIELAVEIKSPCCGEKVRKVLENMKGITSVEVNAGGQRVVVEGQVMAETVRQGIESQTGIAAVILGQGSGEHNLGAGVAAIKSLGHGVLGLLRFVQKSPDTCVFEGSLDNLPVSNTPLFMAVHQSGDLSKGCESCGPVLTKKEGFNGIISPLVPDAERKAEFNVSSQEVELSEMIGRGVCVHSGDVDAIHQGNSQRLACGIIARASGLFQNSKRFCACDGVTIWEQKHAASA